MNILIVGSDANAYSIAKEMSKNENVDLVFVASGNEKIAKFAQCTDISENDIEELLDFSIANEISLTIVTSISAIQNNIGELFADARRMIFAPTADAAMISLYKSSAKKMMYRLKIPTIKFGIFEKENQAIEYASTFRKALVIKNDTHILGERPTFAATFSKAKSAIERCFTFPENKVIIEDYIDAKEVSMYFITDGYTALPIGTCASDEKNFAYPESVYSPDYYISNELELKILNEAIYPVIDDIASRYSPYCGIIGVDLFVDGENYNVIEYNPFFKQMHLQSILPLIKEDLYDLFLSSASGSLSDEYKFIDFYNKTALSKIVGEKIDDEKSDDENLDISYTSNSNAILTQCAKTLTRARENLSENLQFLTEKECEVKNG